MRASLRILGVTVVLVACNYPATKFTSGDGGTAIGDGGGGTPAMLAVSPAGDFMLGTVLVGQSSATTTVTVSNSGDEASGTLSVMFDDTTLGFIVMSDTCSGQPLGGHDECSFGLVFSPTASAAAQTVLHVAAQPGGDVMRNVAGTGLVQGQIDITESSFTYPNQGLGAQNGTHTFTVRNTGQSQIGIPAPSTASGDPAYVVQSTTCVNALGPTDTCTVTITFAPTAVGQIAGSLVVTATPGGSDVATLGGTAFAHVVVTQTGTGGGSVATAIQPGISCPGTCAADFTTSPITLQATANQMSTFTGWSNACTGTSACQLTLDGAKTVGATFNLAAFPVTINLTSTNVGNNAVTSSPSGVTCTATTCTGSFTYGTNVVLTAAPDPVSGRFTGWSAGPPCNGSTQPTCSFTIPDVTTQLGASFDWFAVVMVSMNSAPGFATTPTQVTTKNHNIACMTSNLSGTCTTHYDRGEADVFTFTGAPSWMSEFSICQPGDQMYGQGSGLNTLPNQTICDFSGNCSIQSFASSQTFSNPGVFMIGFNTWCQM